MNLKHNEDLEGPLFEKFSDLSEDIKFYLGQHFLSISDLANLAKTNKNNFRLFQPLSNVNKLLFYFVRGHYAEALLMLDQDINLLLKKGDVVDHSGRHFYKITVLQYALWALDYRLWSMLLSYIQTNKDYERIITVLRSQYLKFDQIGVTYQFKNQLITEKHYDFSLIQELEIQVDFFSRPINEIENWDEMKNQWIHGVGMAQLKLPIHIVFEFCSNEFFHKDSKFLIQPEAIQTYVDTDNLEFKNWYDAANNNQLGTNFAIIRGNGCYATIYKGPSKEFWLCPALDLEALKKLKEVRTLNLAEMKEIILGINSGLRHQLNF